MDRRTKFGIIVMVVFGLFYLLMEIWTSSNPPTIKTPTREKPSLKNYDPTEYAIGAATLRAETWPSETSERYIQCADAVNFGSQWITCQIPKAYCSFNLLTEGSPTFCNDQPYPNHNFTMVFWETDVSSADGKCILVSGIVTFYDGKPQIVAAQIDQIQYCP